ncbi:MAG: sigma factor G inhibitor Gin [Clostridium sp.]
MIRENSIKTEVMGLKGIRNKEIERKKCVICEGESCLSENKINGIIINGEYICRQCEKKIVETNVIEEKYDDYKEKIKVVIYK